MRYNVMWLTPKGEIEKVSVNGATSTQHAIEMSGLPANYVESVRRDIVGGVIDRLTKVQIPEQKQVLMLSMVSASILSGQGKNADRALTRMLERDRSTRKLAEQITRYTLISEKLRVLGYPEWICAMAEIGEKSSQLGEVLAQVADDVIERRKLLASMGKGITMGIILMVVGLVAIVGLPTGMGGFIQELMETPGMQIETNGATELLFLIRDIVTTFWPIALVAAIAIFLGRQVLWPKAKHLPFLQLIAEYRSTGLALRFLTGYEPLFRAQIPLMRSMRLLARSAQGSDAEIYDHMHERIKKGDMLSDAIMNAHWPEALKEGFQGFESSASAQQAVRLQRLKKVMHLRIEALGASLSRTMYMIGALLSITAVVILMGGFLLPLMSASGGG